MSEFEVLSAAAAGMDAQRAALEVAARNVAAAEAAPAGGTFARLVPQFSVAPAPQGPQALFGFDEGASDAPAPDSPDSPDSSEELPVRFTGTQPERGGDADAITEMVAVLDAQRAYEANASVFDLGKRLAERTIDLGRL
jgi:flagellar basal-body rod protein FlgC